jgi:hypothetical protein
MSLESDGGMILTGENRIRRRKTCPSATLYTTNPTRIVPVANPSLRGETPETNHLSHDTAVNLFPYLLHVSIVSYLIAVYYPARMKVSPLRRISVELLRGSQLAVALSDGK